MGDLIGYKVLRALRAAARHSRGEAPFDSAARPRQRVPATDVAIPLPLPRLRPARYLRASATLSVWDEV